MKLNRGCLVVLFVLTLMVGCDPALVAGERVDLRGNSTPGWPRSDYSLELIREQGGRNTCQTFAAVAALEAAYQREMGLVLDLSEEFTNNLGKNFFLRYDLFGTDYSANAAENMLSMMGGGSGLGWIRQFASGFGVPVEGMMGYRANHSLSAYCASDADCGFGTADYYQFISLQKNIGSFNLNPINLPLRALTADAYYSVKSFGQIANASDPAQIEAILREGYEVVWDFSVAGYTGNDAGDYIWRPQDSTIEVTIQKGANITDLDALPVEPTTIESVTQGDQTFSKGTDWVVSGNNIQWVGGGRSPSPGTEYRVRLNHANRIGDHVMLIVGFDTSDPENPYFIVKNSWGRDGTADEDGDGTRDGWTLISYDYIQYGYKASYIIEVNPPRTWPELAFVGRWNTSFDGHHGILDIYHLPGILQEVLDREADGVEDHRLGVYYDEDGTAYRVNGLIEGGTLTFYIDRDTPRMPIDQISGTSYTFFLYREELDTMSGYYFDESDQKGAYALRCTDNWGACGTNWLESQFDSPRPVTSESWYGTWELDFDGILADLRIRRLEPSAEASDGLIRLNAEMHSARLSLPESPVPVWVDPAEPDVLVIELENPIVGETRNVYFRLLDSESGVAVGSTHHIFLGETDFGGHLRRRSAMLEVNITSPRLKDDISPREGSYLFGVDVYHDPALECCTYLWTSDGVALSTERMPTIWGYDLPNPGLNFVSVTVWDSAGNEGFDSIAIQFPDDTPATIEIVSPHDGATFHTTDLISLLATTFDPDNYPDFIAAGGDITWFVDGMYYGNLHSVTLEGLEVGKHHISVFVYGQGVEVTDQVDIYIVEPEAVVTPPTPTPTPVPAPNHSPDPLILQPSNGETLEADTYNSDINLWYVAATLRGRAFDDEDGTLTGASLVWSFRIDGGPWQVLGTGENLPVKFYAPACYGHEVDIRLTARDSDEASKSYKITIILNLFC